jgi:hypothetical protein
VWTAPALGRCFLEGVHHSAYSLKDSTRTETFEEFTAFEQVMHWISHSREIQLDTTIVEFLVQLLQHFQGGDVSFGTSLEIEYNCPGAAGQRASPSHERGFGSNSRWRRRACHSAEISGAQESVRQ